MTEIMPLLLAFLAGIILGGIFFAGLWWTVQKSVSASQPALWFLGSFILRTGVVGAGFYLVGAGNWQKILICLAGFLLARFIVTRYTEQNSAKIPDISK